MMSKTVVVPIAGQSEADLSSMDGDAAPLRSGAQGRICSTISLAHKNFKENFSVGVWRQPEIHQP
ncbi:hypothetical protein V6Z93_007055 [Aspergillus fumigatus]